MENKTTSFALPAYHHPDTASPRFAGAPDARWQRVERDGVAPEHFHGTSMYPEYFKLDGRWRLAEESRMDGCVVVGEGGSLRVVESRHLRAGARAAMEAMIGSGYCHGLLAGNALATHDLEAALLHTALGQDIYTQRSQPNGHYHHLDVLNRVRRSGSIPQFMEDYHIDNGIMYSCVKHKVPFVLTGSIRDDGPLPEVYADAYQGAAAMRNIVRSATTVICLATMLHTIATGNMTPSFRVLPDGTVRPVYLYAVDAEEFVVNKLRDRGSLSATTMVTNVQDFITKVARDLGVQP